MSEVKEVNTLDSAEPMDQENTPRDNSVRVSKRLLAAALAGTTLFGVYTHTQYRELQSEKVNIADENQRLKQQTDHIISIAGGGTVEHGQVLKTLDQLPGYAKEVIPAAEQRFFRQAAVRVVARDRSNGEVRATCSGLKVSIDGDPYVLSAGHCLDEEGLFSSNPKVSAFNVTNSSPHYYGELTVSEATQPSIAHRLYDPVFSNEGDWALMRSGSDTNDPLFDALSAVPIMEHMSRPEPKVGATVRVFNFPGAAKGKLVEGEGIYLGMRHHTEANDAAAEWKYVVGLTNASTPEKDACNRGSSGSIALFPNGAVSGPLSYRVNMGYVGVKNDSLDTKGLADRYDSFGTRLAIEKTLGIDTSSFATLCEFAAPSQEVLQNLLDAHNNQPITSMSTDYIN